MAQKPSQPTKYQLTKLTKPTKSTKHQLIKPTKLTKSTRRRDKRHLTGATSKFLVLLTAVLMPLSVSSNFVQALPMSSEGNQRWSFSETMENRQKYEPLVDAECELYSFCEFETFNRFRDEGDLDGYSIGIMNSHPLFITSVDPQTGAVKIFFNDRAALLGERFQDEERGVYATITSFSLTWKLKNSDQTYVLNDISKLIPQQETDITPEGFEIPEGDSLDRLNLSMRSTSQLVVSTYDIGECTKLSSFNPGQQCTGILDSQYGLIFIPESELVVETPTHYPAKPSTPYAPRPLQPETTPSPSEETEQVGTEQSGPVTAPAEQGNTTPNLFAPSTGHLDQLAALGSSQLTESDLGHAQSDSKLPLAPNTGFAPAPEGHEASPQTLPRPYIPLISFTVLLFVLNLFARIRAFRR